MQRSKSCLIVLAVMLAVVFGVLFVGSVIFGQSRASGQSTPAAITTIPASAMPWVTVQQTALSSPGIDSAPMVEVTVVGPPSTTPPAPTNPANGSSSPIKPTDTPGGLITATPGLAGLGTMTFPLTVTAQFALDQTRVAGVHERVGATETAIEQESRIIYLTLTASAPKPGK